MGAEVVLQNHPEVVAVVKDDRQIEYQGKAYSLSALAQKIMQTTYPLQGPVHWLYLWESPYRIFRKVPSSPCPCVVRETADYALSASAH